MPDMRLVVIAEKEREERDAAHTYTDEEAQVAVTLYRALRSGARAARFWAGYYNVPEEAAPAPQTITRWSKAIVNTPSGDVWRRVTDWLEQNLDMQLVSFTSVVVDRLMDEAETIDVNKLIYIADRATSMLQSTRYARKPREAPKTFTIASILQTTPVADMIGFMRQMALEGVTGARLIEIAQVASVQSSNGPSEEVERPRFADMPDLPSTSVGFPLVDSEAGGQESEERPGRNHLLGLSRQGGS